MAQKDFKDIVIGAFLYFLHMLIFVVILCPFGFWKGATERLAKLRDDRSIQTFIGKSRWPFFTFIKKIFFEYIVDGSIFISYPLGILCAFVVWLVLTFQGQFGSGFMLWVAILIGAYYYPLYMSVVRDIVTLLLLPFQKFVRWCAKEPQYLDLHMTKTEQTSLGIQE